MAESEMDFVRVTDQDTGVKQTIRRAALPHGNYRELKQPAVDSLGDVLPPEYPDDTPPPKATAPKKAATKRAATKKTASSKPAGDTHRSTDDKSSTQTGQTAEKEQS